MKNLHFLMKNWIFREKLYAYVYAYAYARTRVRAYARTHVRTRTCMRTCTCTCTHTRTHTRTCAHTRTRTRTRTRTLMCMCRICVRVMKRAQKARQELSMRGFDTVKRGGSENEHQSAQKSKNPCQKSIFRFVKFPKNDSIIFWKSERTRSSGPENRMREIKSTSTDPRRAPESPGSLENQRKTEKSCQNLVPEIGVGGSGGNP